MNIKKSKVVIFAKGRQAHYSFVLDDQTLDIENECKYLGVLFSRSGSFFAAKKLLAGQTEKAMYGLIRKSRSLMLPIDLQIELFEKMVQPILLYGGEVWGFGNLDVLERVVLKYLKLILNMKTSTPDVMVYGLWRNRGFSYLHKYLLPHDLFFGQLLSQAHLLNYSTVFIVQLIVYISLKTTAIISLNGFAPLGIFYVIVVLVEYGTINYFSIKHG